MRAVLAAAACAALLACSKKPRAGEECTATDRRCLDATHALFCDGARFVQVECSGPAGCRASGDDARCDRSIAHDGERCTPAENSARACTPGKTALVQCDGHQFAHASDCRGPKACDAAGDAPSCDDSTGAAGEPCASADATRTTTCSPDRAMALRCIGGKLTPINACRGKNGCAPRPESRSRVHCDDSVAAIDDPCDTPNQAACSADGKAELACKSGKFVKVRECRRECRADEEEVRCE